MTDINGLPFKKQGRSLVPSSHQSDDWLSNVKDGSEVLLSGRRARNIKFHRLLFAMLHKIVDNTDRWANEEILLADLKEHAGYGHYRTNGFTGEVKFEAESISFAKCDEYKFRRLFNRFVYVLATDVLNVEPQALIDEVFEMVEGDKKGAWKYETNGASRKV